MKKILDFSVSVGMGQQSFIGSTINPTINSVFGLYNHMTENYPNPRYVWFSATIWDPESEEKILRPRADGRDTSLADFWDEIQKLLVD